MRRVARLLVESLETRRLLAAVNIPVNLTGTAGSVVAAPVRIDSANGVRAAEIRINYDTDILNIDSNAIQVGSLWASNSDTQVTANVNDAAGTIVLFVSSASSLADIAGSLAILNFTIASGATVADSAVLNLTLVTLNEGTVPVVPAPTAGADSTDGLITVSSSSTGNGAINGFVFADANKSGAVDVGEPIAGVVVTLTNSATGATQQTTSNSDGSYSFANLIAGSYQLSEQQPLAFFEGGVNVLNVQVTAGSNLTNQNFVEGGLQPAALFTRLRTTLVMPVGSTAWQSAIANVVQTVNATSATQSVLLASTSSSPSIAALSSFASSAANTNQSSLSGEGEYVAPLVLGSSAAPLSDIEAREKQRIAAFEQAMLEL